MRRFLGFVCAIGLILPVSRAETDTPNLIVTLKADREIPEIDSQNGTRTLGRIPATSIYLLQIVDGEDEQKLISR